MSCKDDWVMNKTSPFYFEEEMSDGRLTADFDTTIYHFRDMINMRSVLGRPLTEEEMRRFEIKD